MKKYIYFYRIAGQADIKNDGIKKCLNKQTSMHQSMEKGQKSFDGYNIKKILFCYKSLPSLQPTLQWLVFYYWFFVITFSIIYGLIIIASSVLHIGILFCDINKWLFSFLSWIFFNVFCFILMLYLHIYLNSKVVSCLSLLVVLPSSSCY